LIWQPLSNSIGTFDDNAERLLASSGEDGVINLWNARGDLGKPKCTMAMESAVVAIAFTPDGAFLAGATSKHVLIWRLEDTTMPRARWVRGPELGWQSPRMNESDVEEEDQHCLCWDADGQKLAYGVNSQVSLPPSFLPCPVQVLIHC
jgi:transducin (beta)-like 1